MSSIYQIKCLLFNIILCKVNSILIYNSKSALTFRSVQFGSVAQSCSTLCDPKNCSMPGLPVHHQLLEFTQTHVHRVGDAIQPTHPLSSPSPPVPNPSQHQSLFQWVNSSHEVAKVLEFQLSIIVSKEIPGLISFRIDWLDILAALTLLFSLLVSLVQLPSHVLLCDPMNHSTPGFPVHHQLPEFTQTHVCWVGDAIQPSHPLSSPFPPAPNPSQHQSLFQWVNSSHEVAKALEFQL